jgi:dTDP-4-amino-4,6-dideoxygalactose transaminase
VSAVSEIPGEAWEYSLMDAARGITGGLRRAASGGSLEILGLPDCIPVRSARAGIIVAIRALRLSRGASIAVPLYCCPVVLKAVKHAGCRPLFIDIEPATYCMSADDLSAKAALVDAAVVVHMFGNTCDMAGLRAVMSGRPII